MQAFYLLKYGTIGLCAFLTYFAYRLLAKEQSSTHPRKDILRLIQLFIALAVVSMVIGLISQLKIFQNAPLDENPTIQWASGFDPTYFNAEWEIDMDEAHDVAFHEFKPRYRYSGTLKGRVEGADLVLSGVMTTYDIDSKAKLGSAQFTSRGRISNNQVAGFFTYARPGISGFGTNFTEFDSAGNGVMYMTVRITKVIPNEGDVAQVEMHMHRISNNR